MTKTMLYVGCCNRALPYFATSNGQGIAAFEFAETTGRLTQTGVTPGIDNPTYLAVSPDARTLYATSEVLGWNEGTITAYEIDRATGALSYINKQPSRGSILAQLSFDRTGRFVLAANYGVGPMTQRPNRSVAVFPRAADGELGPPVAEVSHSGSGKDPARQDRPHAHCVRVSPDNRHAIAADLGTDRLVVYKFDAATGRIAPRSEAALPPGCGPRHFVFHPKLPYLYVVNELASTVASLSYGVADGRLTLLAAEHTVPAAALDTNHCSEIAIAPGSDHLYVANRGHDSLSKFRMDALSGIAKLETTIPSGGKTPRHFAFDPGGGYLAVANQDSDAITVFAVDPATGDLLQVPNPTPTGTPTCIAFAQIGL